MALPLGEAGARRNFAALPALAGNGEKRGRSERAEEVTKRALEKCGDGPCGGAESSAGIPLLPRVVLFSNSSAEQRRPESLRTLEKEQAQNRAPSAGLGNGAPLPRP